MGESLGRDPRLDVRGNVIARRQTVEGVSLVVRYAYTAAGLPSRITYPSGAVVSYGYDRDRLASIHVNGEVALKDIAYEPFGAVAGWVWGNGIQSSRGYDPNGQLQHYSLPGERRELGYDNTGNIIGMTGSGIEQRYAYDTLDRLTAAQATDFDLAYRYDANGNRTGVTDSGITLAYAYAAGSNHLAAIGAQARQYDANGNTLADGRHTYTYDANNRLVAVDGTAATYTHNAFGQRVFKQARQRVQLTADLDGDGRVSEADLHALQGYIRAGGAPPEADLNGDGRVDGQDIPCVATRIGGDKRHGKAQPRKSPGAEGAGPGGPHACRVGEWIETARQTRFVYEGAQLLGEYAADGRARQEVVWLGGQPVAVLQGGRLYHVHTDQLGAPRAVSDAAGTVLWRWEARPFGDTLPEEDADGDGRRFGLNLRYPGQYFDAETGLHYNYQRYYDSTLGRYLTSDPIGLAGGLNIYAYVGGNPLHFIDPYGWSKFDKFFGLPKKFWQWYHRNEKRPGDPDLDKDSARELYEEWKEKGSPGPDSKDKGSDMFELPDPFSLSTKIACMQGLLSCDFCRLMDFYHPCEDLMC